MKKLCLVICAVTFVLSFSSIADALMLELDDGAVAVTISDGGLGDSNSLTGAITYNGPVGANWILNVTTGISYPTIMGEPYELAKLDLNTVDMSSNGSSTLSITLSDTGFILDDTLTSWTYLSEIGGVTAGVVTYQTFYDDGIEHLLTNYTTPQLGPFEFSETGSIESPSSPFTLKSVATITHEGSFKTTSFNATNTAVTPEPSSLILLGVGLLGIGGYGFRRRRAREMHN